MRCQCGVSKEFFEDLIQEIISAVDETQVKLPMVCQPDEVFDIKFSKQALYTPL